MRRSLAIALVCSATAAALTTASARPGRSLNKAAQIMARCVNKTRALRRFTCTMEVQILGMREPPSLKEKDQVVFDGPRRMAVRELSLAVSGKWVGVEVANGISCDKLQIGPDEVDWIGREDGLIRRVETELTAPMRIIESYTNFKIGGVIPPEEFAIKPPEGAQRIDSF